ncbi:hypothetical protein BV22DRAFT_1134693 [Leucogyrophana mollusca]|uniref:Uncharacterized protein n=1 Tax=Leucogyrophana mollusca TaxID=85980 RepID=A0ACB8AYN6_9AGAM|nr:hypothetical protein BV22DRAFT_1134693 [Leucogyrophana mollusca]
MPLRSLSKLWAAQPTTSGIGSHFETPQKTQNKRKTTTFVTLPGRDTKRRQLEENLQRLMGGQYAGPETPPTVSADPSVGVSPDTAVTAPEELYLPDTMAALKDSIAPEPKSTLNPQTPKRCILPNGSTLRLYQNWKAIIPALISPHLVYFSATQLRTKTLLY